MRKIHCSTRKNTIRNSQFIQKLTPRTSSEIANLSKNLLLGLELSVWLCVLSSSDRLITPINCYKTHHQPSSFTHSLINLLYWAYWAHILFHLGLGYNLWPYIIYFENLLIGLHVFYVFNMDVKFYVNQNLFTILFINLFFIYNFKLQKLEI